MLLLLPLQWAAAQMHESRSYAESAMQGMAAPTQVAVSEPRGSHSLEAVGAPCKFHKVAQPSALAGLFDQPSVDAVGSLAWSVPADLDHHSIGAANDIERPQWRVRVPSTVDRQRRA